MKAFENWWDCRNQERIKMDRNFGSSEYAGDCFTIGKSEREEGWKAALEWVQLSFNKHIKEWKTAAELDIWSDIAVELGQMIEKELKDVDSINI